MKKLTPKEKRILEFHKKNNFRSITNDNVKEAVYIFEKLDPETAKALIEQMPNAISGMVEIESLYKELLTKGIDSCESTLKSCFESEDTIIETCREEAKEDIPFEQKQYFVEQMVAAVGRKEKKDTEHRLTIDKIMKFGIAALTLGAGVIVAIFLGGNGGASVSSDQ